MEIKMNKSLLIMASIISALLQGAESKKSQAKLALKNDKNGLVRLSPSLTFAFDHKTKVQHQNAKLVHDLLDVKTKWRELSEEDFIAKGLCEKQSVKNLFALYLLNQGQQESLPKIQELIDEGCVAENPESCYIKAMLLKRNEVFARYEDTGLEEAKFYLERSLSHTDPKIRAEAEAELQQLQAEMDRIAAIETEKRSHLVRLIAKDTATKTKKAKVTLSISCPARNSNIEQLKKLPLNSLDNTQLEELGDYYKSEGQNEQAIMLFLKSSNPEVIFKAEPVMHYATPKQGIEIVKKICQLTKSEIAKQDLEYLKTLLINYIGNQNDTNVSLYGASVLLDTNLPDKFIFACAQTDKTFKQTTNLDQLRSFLVKYELVDSKLQVNPKYYESNSAEAYCLQALIDLKFKKPDAILKLAEAVDQGSISACLSMASLILKGDVDATISDALELLERAAPTIPFANYMCAQILADKSNDCFDIHKAIPYIKRALEFGCNEDIKSLLCRHYLQGLCPELEEHFSPQQISQFNKELEDSSNPVVAGNACFNRVYNLLTNFKPGNFLLQEKIFFKYANKGVELGNQECILALARYLVDTGEGKKTNYEKSLNLLRENYDKMNILEVLHNAKLEEYRILVKTNKLDEAKSILLAECKLGNPHALIYDACNRLLIPNIDDTLQQTKDSMLAAETSLKEYARLYGLKNLDQTLNKSFFDYRDSLMLKLITEAKSQLKKNGKILDVTIELATKTITGFRCSADLSAEFLKLIKPEEPSFGIIMQAREDAQRMTEANS